MLGKTCKKENWRRQRTTTTKKKKKKKKNYKNSRRSICSINKWYITTQTLENVFQQLLSIQTSHSSFMTCKWELIVVRVGDGESATLCYCCHTYHLLLLIKCNWNPALLSTHFHENISSRNLICKQKITVGTSSAIGWKREASFGRTTSDFVNL